MNVRNTATKYPQKPGSFAIRAVFQRPESAQIWQLQAKAMDEGQPHCAGGVADQTKHEQGKNKKLMLHFPELFKLVGMVQFGWPRVM